MRGQEQLQDLEQVGALSSSVADTGVQPVLSKLSSNAENYAVLLQCIPAPTALLNSSGLIVGANEAFAAETAARIGHTLEEIVCAGSWMRLLPALKMAVAGAPVNVGGHLYLKSQAEIAATVHLSPIALSEGEKPLVLLRLDQQETVLKAVGLKYFPDQLHIFDLQMDAATIKADLEALVDVHLEEEAFSSALRACREQGRADVYAPSATMKPEMSGHDPEIVCELRMIRLPVGGADGGKIMIIARESFQNPKRIARERQLAYQDPLTHLANRRAFMARLEVDLEEVHRERQNALAVIYLDLDNFKFVNDLGGHDAGDRLLRSVARVLDDTVADKGCAGRLGGDEFALSIPVFDEAEAFKFGWGILERLAEIHLQAKGQTFRAGGSVGIAVYKPLEAGQAFEANDLLTLADEASLSGKRDGGGAVYHAPIPFGEVVRIDRRTMGLAESELPVIADLGLSFQPVKSLQSGRTIGGEVYLRPSEAIIEDFPLANLLSVAERKGFVAQIDSWVIDRVLGLLEQKPGNSWLSVNISGHSAVSADLRNALKAQLGRNPVLAKSLCLEISEKDVLGGQEEVCQFIQFASSLGCQIAIDDFLGNWSALSQVSELKVDWVKLDSSLTARVTSDMRVRLIIQNLVKCLRELGIRSVAKHVETEEQLAVVKELGVFAAQGYYCGRPKEWPDT